MKKHNRHHKKKGFTLIELLIVISIIGVLSTFFFNSYLGVQARARDGQRKSDLRQIQSALELYRSDIGSYPLTDSYPACGASLVGTGSTPSTYIQKMPCDPKGTTYYNASKYYYSASSTGNTYDLVACIESTSDTSPDVTGTPGGSAPTTGCSTSKYFKLQNP